MTDYQRKAALEAFDVLSGLRRKLDPSEPLAKAITKALHEIVEWLEVAESASELKPQSFGFRCEPIKRPWWKRLGRLLRESE